VADAAPRAIRLLQAGEPHAKIHDTLILKSDERRTHRVRVTSARGIAIELDLPEPTALHTDDVLLLDNGELIDVVAAPELLLEVRGEHSVLARVAWALGDRHVPAQFLPNRIRLRDDPALKPLIAAIGGKMAAIEAPFEPEGGAYEAAQQHGHQHHDHGHHHHGHDHHHHGHDHGHDHDHQHDHGAHVHKHDHGKG